MSNTMRYQGLYTNRGPSAALWGNCHWSEIEEGMIDGSVFRDDFMGLAASGSGYQRLAADSGASAALIGTEDDGVISLITGATLNNEVYVNSGNAAGVLSQIKAANGPLWFETRCRLTGVAGAGVFIGLGAAGLAAANALADTTGAPADASMVGFRILNAAPTVVDAVYRTLSGNGEIVHQAGATGIADQTIATAVWNKYGLYFDGTTCFFYMNGKLVNTSGVAISAADFPDTIGLAATWLLKTTTSASVTLDVDWVRFAHTNP